jgi:hypothetical protein
MCSVSSALGTLVRIGDDLGLGLRLDDRGRITLT